MNFGEAKQELCDDVNRPKSEFDVFAGRAINHACMFTTRLRQFNALKKMTTVTYPANTERVEYSYVCNGPITKIISAYEGERLLRIITQEQLNEWKKEYQENSVFDSLNYQDYTSEESYFDLLSQHVLFTSGMSFGLHPKPTSDRKLKLFLTVGLPKLVLDSDTNFLLEHAWDYISLAALQRLNIFLKEDERLNVTASQLSILWQSVVNWDTSLEGSTWT